MAPDASSNAELRTIIDAALRGELDKEAAERLYDMGPDATLAVMLAVNARLAELADRDAPAAGAHTPPGSIPPYAKPAPSKRTGGKPGARKGHPGHRRAPAPPDERVEAAELKTCPECAHEVRPARRRRTRIVEDMPEDTSLTATEYTIPRHWCPSCRRHVEPKVSAALPKCAIGNRLAAMTTVFHYGLGLTVDQTRDVLLSPMRTTVSAGGLVDLWRRVAGVLAPWYEQIADDVKNSAVLHADETGWRVDGKTNWLWCFANDRSCCYMIDPSRGSPALASFFTEDFDGVLISDFWSAYGRIEAGDRQRCLAHLLRELNDIDERKPPNAGEWSAFSTKLRRLIRDGIDLRRRDGFTPERYASRIERIDARLMALAQAEYSDPDASRLAARLLRHRDELFTFLDRPEADWNNNLAERMIRPAVVLRKGSQCNRSDRGAATQAVLMSVHRTLKLRGVDPRAAIADALTAYAGSGTPPPLPVGAAGG